MGFPRGFAAAFIQVSAIGGLMGRQNEIAATIRNQQLAANLYEPVTHRETTMKILTWFGKNQLTDELASIAGRIAGSWFTGYALQFRLLPAKVSVAGRASNMLLAAYGSAILRVADGDEELARIIGAVVTGRGDFEICVPIDKFRQDLRDMKLSEDPVVAKAFQFLKEVQEFALGLGRG